jgi:uncharacterized protein involved in cysteine biosynthesis
MNEKNSISTQIGYFFESLRIHQQAIEFIKKHRLWEGFRKAGWAWKISVLAGILVSLRFLAMIFEWIGLISSSKEGISVVKGAMGLWDGFSDFGKDLVQTSGLRYIMLLFVEVLIFHFAVKTLNILENEERVPTLNDFIRAQIRMLKVIVRSWIFEMIFAGIVSVILGILGFDSIQMVFIFAVQCYFLGFAYLDNYNEQYDHNIKESAKIIRQYYGAAMGIGLVNYGLFLIPLFGPIIAPFIGAVASSLFMFKYIVPENDRDSMELV